jgi:prevent-host-death family protein
MKLLSTVEVGTFEAKNKLSSLVEQAARGQNIWITKRGKRVALLSSGSADSGTRVDDLLNTFHRIRSTSKSGSQSLKSLIEEGRK